MKTLLYRLAVVGLALAGCDRASDDAGPEPEDAFRHTFIPNPDVGGGTDFPCDLYTQDCPEGDKCMPYSNDGGAAWNATRCSPVAAVPGAVGQPCTVEGSGVSGLDDCERGAMCWDVDPQTNEGTCVAMITGSPVRPICADPMTSGTVSGDGVLNLCLAGCRPLQDDCPAGQGCYPFGDRFSCAPDTSGEGGNAGDACEFINACSSGLACIGADALPDCSLSAGCCSPYCDTTRPVCPDGLTCEPWSDETTVLPGGDNLGICLG